jgi:hypothetical protein
VSEFDGCDRYRANMSSETVIAMLDAPIQVAPDGDGLRLLVD